MSSAPTTMKFSQKPVAVISDLISNKKVLQGGEATCQSLLKKSSLMSDSQHDHIYTDRESRTERLVKRMTVRQIRCAMQTTQLLQPHPPVSSAAALMQNAMRAEMNRRAVIEAAEIRSRISVYTKKNIIAFAKTTQLARATHQSKNLSSHPASLPVKTESLLRFNAQKSSSSLNCSCSAPQGLGDKLSQLNSVVSDLPTLKIVQSEPLVSSQDLSAYISQSNAPQLPQLLTKNVGVYSRALVSIQLKLPLHTIPPAQTNSTGYCANIPRPVPRWKKIGQVGDKSFNGTKISAMGIQQLVITTAYQGCFRTKAMTDLQPSNLLYTAKFQQTATSIPAHARDDITPTAQKRVSKKAVLNMDAILDQLAQGKTLAQCYGEYVQTNNGQPLYGRSMFHKLIQDRRASVATRSEGFVEPDIPSPIREVADVGPA